MKFNEWKDANVTKETKVNMGKTKVMVSEGEIVVGTVDPCGVCYKRGKANSVLCIVCSKWVHKKCSGVKNSLNKVFQCKACV